MLLKWDHHSHINFFYLILYTLKMGSSQPYYKNCQKNCQNVQNLRANVQLRKVFLNVMKRTLKKVGALNFLVIAYLGYS